MAISFNESQTKINLMRAFAGESQARNRYYFAAEEAKKQKIEDHRKKQSDENIPEKERAESKELMDSIIKRYAVFEKIKDIFDIDLNFVVTYNSRFSSNVSKFQQEEVLIKYKNFE